MLQIRALNGCRYHASCRFDEACAWGKRANATKTLTVKNAAELTQRRTHGTVRLRFRRVAFASVLVASSSGAALSTKPTTGKVCAEEVAQSAGSCLARRDVARFVVVTASSSVWQRVAVAAESGNAFSHKTASRAVTSNTHKIADAHATLAESRPGHARIRRFALVPIRDSFASALRKSERRHAAEQQKAS